MVLCLVHVEDVLWVTVGDYFFYFLLNNTSNEAQGALIWNVALKCTDD